MSEESTQLLSSENSSVNEEILIKSTFKDPLSINFLLLTLNFKPGGFAGGYSSSESVSGSNT